MEAQYDMIVVGGGAIGCSVAFWLMQRVIEGFKILVVERDPQVKFRFSEKATKFIKNLPLVLTFTQ